MVLSSISILPHGAMILDMKLDNLPNPQACHLLHDACKVTTQSILSSLSTDSKENIIILFSPHGMSLSESIAVYQNQHIQGSAEWLGAWSDYKVQFESDSNLASKLVDHMKSNKLCCEGFTFVTRSFAAPLAWGEAVPLWFLSQEQKKRKLDCDLHCKVIVVSWPQLRLQPLEFASTAKAIGKALYEFTTSADVSTFNFSLILSCDMSHVHGCDPGLPSIFLGDASLGCDVELATRFDGQIVAWATAVFEQGDIKKGEKLLEAAGKDVVAAKACGWSGFNLLQGLLEAGTVTHNVQLLGRVNGYAAPTYYGMMAAYGDLVTGTAK